MVMMSDRAQFFTAMKTLGVFRDIWCESGDRENEGVYNCSICEFQTDEGKCLVKVFMSTDMFARTNNTYHLVVANNTTSEVE